MPFEDALRWDRRYDEEERFRAYFQPRPFLVENAKLLPTQGLALDAAMGLGGNASLLLEHGLRVVGVDISQVALQRAARRLPGLMAVQADLTCLDFPRQVFDVIINFYYLQRSLWVDYRRWLRPRGLLIIETMTREMLELQPDIDPLYLLDPGELVQSFSAWEVLVYREGWQTSTRGHRRAVASLVARLP
jgi:ubiquinone/menaquinone biosynthesis C-methylase UbiE